MSLKESMTSQLLQVLLQTKDEPVSLQGAEDKTLETDDSSGLYTLMGEIRELTLEDRGVELRDAARYNDYIMVHTLLYVTAFLSDQSDSGTNTTTTCPLLSEDACSILSKSPVTVARASTLALQLLHSADATTGNTALHMAAANNHHFIIALLLQLEQASIEDLESHGTKDSIAEKPFATRLVQCVNRSGGNTPLHYAITNRAFESIQSILTEYASSSDDVKSMNASDAPIPRFTNVYVDVLQKNSAGRSCLTEAFALSSDGSTDDTDKRNHSILTLVLEHPSANEDRLLDVGSNHFSTKNSSTSTNSAGINQQSALQPPMHHTHQFRFVGSNRNMEGIELRIREMAMASSSSESSNHDQTAILGGDEPINDTTGFGVWSASIIMAQWMTDVFHWNHSSASGSSDSIVRNIDSVGSKTSTLWSNVQTIVELGAGCGVPGLTVAQCIALSFPTDAAERVDKMTPKVFLTDLNPKTILNLQHNIKLNQVSHIASAVTLNWNDLEDTSKIWPWTRSFSSANMCCVDVLIGSDLVYQREAVPFLVHMILRLRPQRFFYGAGKNRDGHDLFIDSLSKSNDLVLIWSRAAPKVFRSSNPLLNQDDDECFIHFHDLLLSRGTYTVDNDDSFTLYEFSWNVSC